VGEAEDVREVFAIAMSPAGLKVRLRRRSGAPDRLRIHLAQHPRP
jgi:hypothetical protein